VPGLQQIAKISRIFVLSLLAVAGTLGGSKLNAAGGEPRLVAAYFHPSGGADKSVLTLFPDGPAQAVDVSLPLGLLSYHLGSFGPDSKSLYFGGPSILATDGVTKIEFGPTRRSVVPGSTGLSIAFLTISQYGKIFLSASDLPNHQCGAYEIDPDAARHRAIRVGAYPDCAGALGKISPDGKNLLSNHSRPRTPRSPPSVEYLDLLDLETGATQSLGEGSGSWSPDGRWIAISGRRRIVLIDARNTSHRKKLGASGVDDNLVWSPDSKQLLFATQERRCSFLFLSKGVDSESLEIVNVETGKRHAIPSAHCAVTSSAVGWIDSEAVR
jgi:hypothetical protein